MSKKEYYAAKVNDFKNGEMKTISVNGNEILLCKTEDGFSALASHCTHYGAPLSEGVLSGDRIVCPWHHACFNVKTGDLLEPPARDSLPVYDVRVDGENIYVALSEELITSRLPKMVKGNIKKDKRTFVIIGGGAAGEVAAQTLREDGFEGKIIMITQENHSPYDRPNLSKDYLAGDADESWMPLRSESFYELFGIDIMLNKKVKGVNFKDKCIDFNSGDILKYDKMLIAPGSIPRKLGLPGEDLKNVFTLRSFDDSKKIIEAGKSGSRAVIIGASFIGMETAYSLNKRGLDVTVISMEEIPFERVFGREVGKLFKNLHEEIGVKFKLSLSLKEFAGKQKVEAVVLQSGESIEADLVILGVGVKPATEFLHNLKLLPDGSVKVNAYLQINEDVFAAGDIVTLPDWRTDGNIRIEHWRNAEQQGRIAAHNMAGKMTQFKCVPFFWTSQVGLSLNYVGHAVDWEEIIFHGDINSKEFIAYYIKDDKVAAAAGNFRDKEMAAIEELMRLDIMPTPEMLKLDSVDLVKLLEDPVES
jgi:NADPH-dependent 2,4-dienoyl-CoA reductase/sulfur reductase-like enzyme/nitrite reductase/ring-hydroxylating ferredoxin subunit